MACQEIELGFGRGWHRECFEIDSMLVTMGKVVNQTNARVFGGDTHVEGKILSVFETSTEVIRKGKASKPTEFGKMVKVQEAENQIVIDYTVYDEKPSDTDLLIPSIETHQTRLGRVPDLAAADAGFYSAKNIAKAEEMGVKRVSVPNRCFRHHRSSGWLRFGTVSRSAGRRLHSMGCKFALPAPWSTIWELLTESVRRR